MAHVLLGIRHQDPGWDQNSIEEVNKMERLKRFLKDEDGVTAIEYGLIAALIAVAIIFAITAVGGNLSTIFNHIAGKLEESVPK